MSKSDICVSPKSIASGCDRLADESLLGINSQAFYDTIAYNATTIWFWIYGSAFSALVDDQPYFLPAIELMPETLMPETTHSKLILD